MKSIIIATATIFIFFSANAQPGSIPVAKIQKLLDRAEGQTYVNVIGNNEKITKQKITETTYTLYYTALEKGTKWVEESTNIQWDKGFIPYSLVPHPNDKNDKLTLCAFDFNNDLNWYVHAPGGTYSDKRNRKDLRFYVLTKDYDEFERLIRKVRDEIPR